MDQLKRRHLLRVRDACSFEREQPDFCALADLFVSLGMASEAATCHSWSLIPPDKDVWKSALTRWLQSLEPAVQREIDCSEAVHNLDVKFKTKFLSGQLEDELGQVQQLVDAGQLRSACKKMSELALQHNLVPSLCNRAAMLYESIADYWEAERWYRTSLSQQPSQIQPWFGLASTLLSQRADDEALEAAVCGLTNQPGHPWGLKLQQRALTNLQAIETLKDLNKKQQLPFAMSSEVVHSESRVDTLFQGYWDESTLSLQQRITIKAHLSGSKPLIWCIGSGSHKALPWLRDQRLLSSSSRVQIFGDPDADIAVQTSLLHGIDVDCMKPMYWLKHISHFPDVAILCQPRSDALPLILSELLRSPSTILVVHHSVDIQPPKDRLIFALGLVNVFVPSPQFSE